MKELHRIPRHYFGFTPNVVKFNAEHRALLETMLRGDAPKAPRFAGLHIPQGKMRVLQTIISKGWET